MEGRVVQIAPVLAEDVRQQALGLAERGLLGKLVTAWVPAVPTAGSMLSWRVSRQVARRRPVAVKESLLRRVPTADVVERMTRWMGGSVIDAVDRRFAMVDRVAARCIRTNTQAVLAREDGCLRSFRRASSAGIPCLYDLPTAHHVTVRRWLEAEIASFPGVCAISGDVREFAPERIARKDAELASADFVLCPSPFVRKSLVAAGMPEKKIFVLPLAAEPAWLMAPPAPREPVFLYVGQISLRKGVHRLLIAWKRLKAHRTHRLRLIGSMRLSDSFLKDFSDVYEHVPVVPRDRLAAYYTRAQALLFNALADGFGMVVTEAMSCGTPILASQNAGASMLVTDLHEGRLFPYGDDDALMTALDWALSHPAELAEMGSLARRKAAEWTWPDYRTAFGEWVQRVQRDAA
jgi:glycosyltransferase involved in cell wall biosynthesis